MYMYVRVHGKQGSLFFFSNAGLPHCRIIVIQTKRACSRLAIMITLMFMTSVLRNKVNRVFRTLN